MSDNGDDYDDLSQGQRANRQGKELLATVRDALQSNEFVRVVLATERGEALAELPKHIGGLLVPARGIFAEQVPMCESPNGGPHRADFLIFARGWPAPLALAGRHQHVSGSAREKLDYLVNVITRRYQCPGMLVLEGPFMAGDARVVGWMRELSEAGGGRLRRVFRGVYEFRQWLTLGGHYPELRQPALL